MAPASNQEMWLRRAVIGCALIVACRAGLMIMSNNIAFTGSLIMSSIFVAGTTGGRLREGSRLAPWLGLLATLHAATGVAIAAWKGVPVVEWVVRIAYLAAAVGLVIAALRLRRVELPAEADEEERLIP